MLEVGSTLLMAVHFLAVDVAMAGPLACIWLARRAARDELAAALNVWLARASLLAFAVAIAAGCLQLLVLYQVNDRDFWRAAAAVPTGRLWFSLAELIFFVVCMAVYLWLAGRPVQRPRLSAGLAILASLDLIYHFPPLFTMLNLLADRPGLIGQPLTRSLYRSLVIDPEVLGMTAHVVLAAIAVTAVLVLFKAHRLAAIPETEAAPLPAVVLSSARTALAATVLQLPVGVTLLVCVPNRLRDALLGEDLLATVAFACGILATVGLLHPLAAVALGDRDTRQIRRSAVLILVTVLFMTAALQRIRQLGRPAAQASAQKYRPSHLG